MSRLRRWAGTIAIWLLIAIMVSFSMMGCWVLVEVMIGLARPDRSRDALVSQIEHTTTREVAHAQVQLLLDEVRHLRVLVETRCK